jgi:hypothetical protein
MDKACQMTDLSEPIHRELSQEECLERQWRLFVVFTQFVTIYACVHKIFIPLALSFSSLKHTPYAEMQVSVLLPIILTLVTSKSKFNNAWLSLICGMCIVFGLNEILSTVSGRNTGWFAFSRLLSSTPMAVACGFALSKSKFNPNYKVAWLGAGVFSVLLVINDSRLQKPPTTSPTTDSAAVGMRLIPANENIDCGAQSLQLPPRQNPGSATNLSIQSCGLNPSVFLLGSAPLEIENTTGEAINLHLIIFEHNKKKTGWNTLLRPHEKRTVAKFELGPNTVGLLYSDSKPEIGITAIRSKELAYTWFLKRKPIMAQELQEN